MSQFLILQCNMRDRVTLCKLLLCLVLVEQFNLKCYCLTFRLVLGRKLMERHESFQWLCNFRIYACLNFFITLSVSVVLLTWFARIVAISKLQCRDKGQSYTLYIIELMNFGCSVCSWWSIMLLTFICKCRSLNTDAYKEVCFCLQETCMKLFAVSSCRSVVGIQSDGVLPQSKPKISHSGTPNWARP